MARRHGPIRDRSNRTIGCARSPVPVRLDRAAASRWASSCPAQIRELVLAGTLTRGDRLPEHPRPGRRPRRRPRGHRAGLRPAARRGLAGDPPRRRHVRRLRRRRRASRTGPAPYPGAHAVRSCASTQARRGSTPGTRPAGAAPGARCPPPARRGGTTTRAGLPRAPRRPSPTTSPAPGAWRGPRRARWSPPAPPTACATCSRRCHPVRSPWRTRATARPSRRSAAAAGRRRPPGHRPGHRPRGRRRRLRHPRPPAPARPVMPAADRLARSPAARPRARCVLEDDYDSEFRYDVAPVPALASLDRSRVAYLGTASKSVAPSLRLGWLVPPPDLLDADRPPAPHHPRRRRRGRSSGRSSRCCATGTSTRSCAPPAGCTPNGPRGWPRRSRRTPSSRDRSPGCTPRGCCPRRTPAAPATRRGRPATR